MSLVPKRFVGLHAHDGFSTFDGMGLPKEHFEFVRNNTKEELETPALAITNHGHMNSYAHAYLYARDLNKAGNRFKFLPGCELYVHPNLAEWHTTKVAKELESTDKEDTEHGSTVENEEETKSNKYLNPIGRKHHLVVLAKHSQGLEHLFSIVSRGYLEGFYKKPRVDYSWLKPFKGEFIASTACIGGPLSYDIYSEFSSVAFDVSDVEDASKGLYLGPHLVDDPIVLDRVLRKVENTIDRLVDVIGQENLFLELQFNRLSAQHLTNRILIEASHRTGIPLIATADSHYCKPEIWRERAIYQKLGWMNYTDYDPSAIPQSIDQLKAELYPKNAKEMWESYQKTGPGAGYRFYDDGLVRDAIERTHDIAFQAIGDVSPDTSVKLPSWSVPKGKTAIQALVELCNDGMRQKGLDGSMQPWTRKKPQQTYDERLKYELEIIDEKKFSEYFLTMKAIIDVAADRMLIGVARGSAAGSLVNYVLGITQIDPIEYDLIFERFINPIRAEFPDIDSDFADRDLLIKLLKDTFGELNVIPISNYNGFQLKSLMKDVSRFFHQEEDDGLSFQNVNSILASLDDEVRNKVLKQGDDKNLFELKLEDCIEHSPRFKELWDSHPEIQKAISVILHENKSLGKHAGGVIISERIPERMPLITSKKEVQTPWVEGMHYKHLNELGYIKYDLLGLETLRIIQRCIELIIKRHSGKRVELDFGEGRKITCFENNSILLTNGTYKRISTLTDTDDVHESLKVVC
jgi:DNA polymerase-3 subunit alpha